MECIPFGCRSSFKGETLMGLDHNLKIQEFLSTVCEQIKCKEVHEDIKLELENHILEIAEDCISSGISEEAAVDKALSQMGDAATIGLKLNKCHKSKPEWSLLILTILFACLGLITNYLIGSNGIVTGESSLTFFFKTLSSSLIGIFLAVILYFFDYRKIQKYSKHIYTITLLMLVLTILIGRPINGIPWLAIGPFGLNFASICPYLFAVTLSGIFENWNWSSIKHNLYAILLILIPPFFILISKSVSSTVIYAAVILAIILVSRRNSKLKLMLSGLFVGSGLGLLLFYIISEPYRIERFLVFIHPERDPLGSGYVNMQLNKVIQSAGMFGQGFTLKPKMIPEINGNFILSFIIYTFGWIAAVLFILTVVCYMIRLVRAAIVIKNGYGRSLISSITAIIATQFIWNILMILSLAPISGVSLPFISYGGLNLIMNMASLGLILSVYRRKDMEKAALC